MTRPRVLFISHDATRTGAPIVLLNLVRWLKENSDLDMHILLKRGGALAADFAEVAPTSGWFPNNAELSLPARFMANLAVEVGGAHDAKKRSPIQRAVRGGLHREVVRRRRARFDGGQGFDLVYANSAGSAELLPHIGAGGPIIAHVHELEYQLRHDAGRDGLRQLLRLPSRYIAAADRVKSTLVGLGVPDDRIDVCREFLDTQAAQPGADAIERAREDLGIPAGTFIVGGSGTIDWRKGTDLFLLVAAAFRRRGAHRRARFLWVGGQPAGVQRAQVQFDIDQLGLSECVTVLPAQANPLDKFGLMDVFLLSSRSDPYPLVCLETAALGKPQVSFDNGGISEFIEDDCGFVVPYLDVEAAADRLVELHDNPELRQRLGRRAAAKVRERHDISVEAPRLLEVVERTLREGAARPAD